MCFKERHWKPQHDQVRRLVQPLAYEASEYWPSRRKAEEASSKTEFPYFYSTGGGCCSVSAWVRWTAAAAATFASLLLLPLYIFPRYETYPNLEEVG
ncbi:unnamed protein product [Notodromas monacha]|uniref:Uncharacterized protein n=1 Tax=Notodromas monacha TaxID=399045 RepID=A0A7R9GDD5_9CRUS|nr:unnamed protein product [Notodromas monacha]CAG0916820.1 unnamed protein product [Notodromas monacha]